MTPSRSTRSTFFGQRRLFSPFTSRRFVFYCLCCFVVIVSGKIPVALTTPVFAADCNGNGVVDQDDVLSQASDDCNDNMVPDECEFAPIELGLGPEKYPLESLTLMFVAGDFNSDELRDVVVVQWQWEDQDNVLEVFLGRQDRTLERQTIAHLGIHRRLRILAPADFDGDGDTDIVAYAGASQIVVVECLGAGDFAPPRIHQGSVTNGLAVGDVNGDGRPDVVTTNRLQQTIDVFVQTGDGSLAEAGAFPVSGKAPASIAVGDLDGDRALDVVTLDRGTQSLSLLINQGGGDFSDAMRVDVGADFASWVRVADIDDDGDLDILVRFDDRLVVYANRGNAEMEPPRSIDIDQIETVLTDIDSDGDLDVIVADPDRRIGIFANVGGGVLVRGSAIPAEAQFVAPGDFDGDGEVDLAVVSDDPGRVEVLYHGLTDRVQFDFVTTPLSSRSRPHQIALGDFDGDGLADVVAANSNLSDAYTVAFNRGDGSFGPILHIPLPVNGVSRTVDTGDLDGDGDIDIFLGDIGRSHPIGSNVAVMENLGERKFAAAVQYPVGAGNATHNVDVADMDGDGDLDALAVSESGFVFTWRNDGSGVLTDFTEIPVGVGPYWGETADLDRDGDLDYAVSDRKGFALHVLSNRGDGVFDQIDRYALPANPRILVASDLDRDGDVDLLVPNGMAVSILRNRGDGKFDAPVSHNIEREPYSAVALDFDGDGILDIGTANEFSGSISILTGRRDGGYNPPFHLPAGQGVRHAIAEDMDLDGDVDIVVGNRPVNSLTVLLNPASDTTTNSVGDFREAICTPRDFHDLSIRSSFAPVERALKFLAPATDDPALLPTVYQNTNRFRLHQDFLAAAFPERFPSLTTEEYGDLVNRRALRQYYAGVINLVRTEDGLAYGFNVLVDSSDVSELLVESEVAAVYETLRASFALEPLGYFPQTNLERELASTWANPAFPIFTDTGPTGTYQPYTRGVAFGRVRLLDRDAFDRRNERGQFTFQDILVLDHAPRDVEAVVAALLTSEPQTENSHTFLRMAIRSTPNAFVADALAALAPYGDKLVRLEVRETEFMVREADLEEAQAFWQVNRPSLEKSPGLDVSFTELSSLEDIARMELAGDTTLVARFGGKATNLARLQSVLDAPEYRHYQEKGFAIPMHSYVEFMRSNRAPSALDPQRMVSYEAYLDELFDDPEFQTDSDFRFTALENLRDRIRDEGVVSPELISRIAARIVEVMGTPSTTRVRFRSSSNIEDDIQFNGAGLYDSTSGCPEDDLDTDTFGPSHCDATRDEERTIARALKRVWRSLWNFKAYEERAFFGVDQRVAAMAVLVNRTFVDEASNGVAFTGNVTNPQDRRYVITAQVGEESVVSPEPGVRAEKNLLTVAGGVVEEILRAASSTLLEPGRVVLTNDQLHELGSLMWHIDQNFPVELGNFSRDQVLLDMEFKFMPDGELAIKQVRPFLLSVTPLPTPEFELEIPSGTEVCSVYVPFRQPADAYAAKSTLRLTAGLTTLQSSAERVEATLIEELVFGPDQETAVAAGDGELRLQRVAAADDVTSYIFTYSQSFSLADGSRLEVSSRLRFRARGDEVLDGGRLVLDDAFFTAEPGNEAFLASVNGVPTIRYGSCDLQGLRTIEVFAEFADGTRLELIERIADEDDQSFFAAPATLSHAQATFSDGQTRQTSSYWQLVYAAENHNDPVDYWLVLDVPEPLPGIDGDVFALEFRAPPTFRETPGGRAGELVYLGADLSPLKRAQLTAFSRAERMETLFRRGDVEADGAIGIDDPLYLLNWLFRRGPAPPCERAADVNDDGRLNLSDAVVLLLHLFRGLSLPEPAEICGVGGESSLSCEAFPSCTNR